MKYIAIRHIAVFAAALLFSSAADAATYTAHYDYVRKPSLPDAAIDAQIQADTANCDNAIGVQRAAPSAGYRSCMLQQGWKYRFVTRDPATRTPADPYFSSDAKVAPGHFIDHDNGMDCQNTGSAEVCDSPNGTVHYYDPDQDLTCTRTSEMSICTNM